MTGAGGGDTIDKAPVMFRDVTSPRLSVSLINIFNCHIARELKYCSYRLFYDTRETNIGFENRFLGDEISYSQKNFRPNRFLMYPSCRAPQTTNRTPVKLRLAERFGLGAFLVTVCERGGGTLLLDRLALP
jgi:hypothetical protein